MMMDEEFKNWLQNADLLIWANSFHKLSNGDWPLSSVLRSLAQCLCLYEDPVGKKFMDFHKLPSDTFLTSQYCMLFVVDDIFIHSSPSITTRCWAWSAIKSWIINSASFLQGNNIIPNVDRDLHPVQTNTYQIMKNTSKCILEVEPCHMHGPVMKLSMINNLLLLFFWKSLFWKCSKIRGESVLLSAFINMQVITLIW